MKKYLLILLYCGIPFWVFSQTPLTITTSATNDGIVYITSPPPAWYSIQQMTSMEVGRPFGSNSGRTGRGFLKFNLSSINSTILANMTKAELLLTTGNSCYFYPTSNDTVKISRTSVTDVPHGNNTLSTTYSNLL